MKIPFESLLGPGLAAPGSRAPPQRPSRPLAPRAAPAAPGGRLDGAAAPSGEIAAQMALQERFGLKEAKEDQIHSLSGGRDEISLLLLLLFIYIIYIYMYVL